MRTFILSALLLAAATPVLAQMPPQDARDEHRDDRIITATIVTTAAATAAMKDSVPTTAGIAPTTVASAPTTVAHVPTTAGTTPTIAAATAATAPTTAAIAGATSIAISTTTAAATAIGDQYARFRADPYYYPRGYAYRYYGVGTFLPRAYFDTRYYIGQPDYYRLPPAFAGTRWIRVGPDALLIRNYDRRVVRVIRGIFY